MRPALTHLYAANRPTMVNVEDKAVTLREATAEARARLPRWGSQAMSAPLFGLLLAGGRSARMGRDKAGVRYGGRTAIERAMDLLATHVERSYVSVRADQVDDPLRRAFPHLHDTHENLGPVAGILAARAVHPAAAWLVLACDLPRLDDASLDHLIAHRAPQRLATAYRSSRDGLPEPLCAIWEPASHAPLVRYVAEGRQCPREFLMLSDVELLQQPNQQTLDNVNTPEEHATIMARAENSASQPVCVRYFALLRQQADRRDEALDTRARTPRDLYEELRARHPFTLGPDVLRVAVNSEFGGWEQPLRAGDTVVFIPPVAGG